MPDWTPLMERLSESFRSHVVAVQAHDAVHRHGRVATAIRIGRKLLDTSETLAREHPWFERGAAALVARGVADDRGLPGESGLRATRFYAESCSMHGSATAWRCACISRERTAWPC